MRCIYAMSRIGTITDVFYVQDGESFTPINIDGNTNLTYMIGLRTGLALTWLNKNSYSPGNSIFWSSPPHYPYIVRIASVP